MELSTCHAILSCDHILGNVDYNMKHKNWRIRWGRFVIDQNEKNSTLSLLKITCAAQNGYFTLHTHVAWNCCPVNFQLFFLVILWIWGLLKDCLVQGRILILILFYTDIKSKNEKKLHSVLIILARRELGHLCLACQDNNLHPFEVDRILTALVLVPTIFHTVMIMDANLKYFGTAWLPSCKQIWIGTKIKKLSINMTINLARACLIYVSLYPPTLPI